jgi:hypothetical protein
MRVHSPVEFKVSRSTSAIVPAPAAQWRRELIAAAQTYAALALTASARSALAAAPAALLGTIGGSLARAGQLYAEVWTIYFFLLLLCSAFATLVAAAGYVPRTMFDAPLTRSTSIADFWSRELA